MENQNYQQSKNCEAFTIVKTQKNTYIIVMGKYQISKKEFTTIPEAETYINMKPWELIINSFNAMLHYEKENNETATKENTKVAE